MVDHGWFSPASSTTKTGRHDIDEILLKVALNTINQINQYFFKALLNIGDFMCRWNRIGGVIISVFPSSAEDRGFEPQSGKTKDYKIGMCCFPATNAALRRKSKDCLVRNQDNSCVQMEDISIRGLLFQCASTIQNQLSMLV